jgi:HB1, ASXL, restriction endonuclease HTH domain
MEFTEWAKLQEELLKAQLKVVRGHLRSEKPKEHERKVPEGQRMSQMRMVTDILTSSSAPLHVTEIIRQAKKRFGVTLDRESMVSALSKKVKKGVTFVRTGPNTFGLKGR